MRCCTDVVVVVYLLVGSNGKFSWMEELLASCSNFSHMSFKVENNEIV